MKAADRCPVCDVSDWKVIGSRTYDRKSVTCEDEYVRKRMRVLFEIWYPDSAQVVNQSLLCNQCGFVTYSPRPSAEDLDRKYRFLNSLGSDQNQSQINLEREQQRAHRLWRKLAPFLNAPHGRVLDFGGGDGRLVAPFADHGWECFVVDYHPQPTGNVTRLGATLNDIDSDEKFDVIVCSHVIEHVAEPYSILVNLRKHLHDGGRIYVEVPMEIWKKPPLHEEPVTHVNFFTVGSMRTLLQRARIRPVRLKMEDYSHPLGHHTPVVSATGEFQLEVTPVITYRGVGETRRLLDPPWTARLQRALLRPQDLPQAILHKLRNRAWT